MIDPPRHAEIDIEEQLDCVRREIDKRKEVYPRLVAGGKLSQEKADQEIDLMRAVLVTLLWANDRDGHAWIYGDEPENEVRAERHSSTPDYSLLVTVVRPSDDGPIQAICAQWINWAAEGPLDLD